MAGPDQRFDFRDLAAATVHSRCDSQPRVLDLRERLAAERCLLAHEVLPALNDDVHILRIQFDSVTGTSRQLSRDERGPAAEKWIIDRLSTLSVIQDWPAHQFYWFLRGVVAFLLFRSAHDEFRGR